MLPDLIMCSSSPRSNSAQKDLIRRKPSAGNFCWVRSGEDGMRPAPAGQGQLMGQGFGEGCVSGRSSESGNAKFPSSSGVSLKPFECMLLS